MKENVTTLHAIWSLLFKALPDLPTALLCQPVVSPSPCSTCWLLVGPSSFLKLPFTSGTVFFQNTMHLKQHQCSLAFTELKDNKKSKANTFADRGPGIWLFVVPSWLMMLVPQDAAQLPAREEGATQCLTVTFPKHPLSRPFLLCPGRFLPRERPYKFCSQTPSFLDRVSWRKMKQETPHHLQPSAARVNATQDPLAFPAPCPYEAPEHHMSLSPYPFTRDTGHVRDTLDTHATVP